MRTNQVFQLWTADSVAWTSEACLEVLGLDERDGPFGHHYLISLVRESILLE
jgi:hypothetical protein